MEDFKLYLVDSEFYSICDWREYKIPVKDKRPVLILVIEDPNYPDCYNCLPISKDDDKEKKYQNLLEKNDILVHPLDEVNHYENYLLIQNMFYLKKEFLGEPFTVEGVHSEIKNEKTRKAISKKVKKANALMKQKKLNYVPRETVYEIQEKYLQDKNAHKETAMSPLNP